MDSSSASSLDFYQALAALEWQIDLGADEAISETPINRFESDGGVGLKDLKFTKNSNVAPVKEMPEIVQVKQSAPEVAALMAGKVSSLSELQNAMGVFDLCALKEGARQLVFADGNPAARVMIIGEAPGRDEDIEGKPFVGRAGQLLDKMFDAIDLSRAAEDTSALYITNVVPWRPPQNRDPSGDEIEMMLPFLKRHIELVGPDMLILMGNTACKAVLGKTGITRMRGNWVEAFGLPVMPMFHPAALLRDPLKKREAWSDLQDIRERLGGSDGH
ncbi:MAG: uracil-DNA glycosylase family protein [Pseudomonadota bacterium]